MSNLLIPRSMRRAGILRSSILFMAVAALLVVSIGSPAAAHAAPNTAPSTQPTSASAAKGALIVSTALKYVGYRYRFGGTTPAGFDCSGFVYYVLNRAGARVPRNMYGQYASGTRVSARNLQPGDMLFFSNTYQRGLSHAGIYIGNGLFVNAENPGAGVRVSRLWSSYWASHFTAAVRAR